METEKDTMRIGAIAVFLGHYGIGGNLYDKGKKLNDILKKMEARFTSDNSDYAVPPTALPKSADADFA